MLSWFRRHAKVLMVVLGSAAMAIFGLGPVFDELASRGQRGNDQQNEVIATWNGGKITRVDLDKWERGHFQAQRFLLGVREAAENKKGSPVISLASPIPMVQDGGRQEVVDDQLISRFLLSERAKKEGVVVSNGMIDDYIKLTAGEVSFSNRDLESINSEVNTYCSLQSVKEHLKFELLATQMQQYASAGIPMVPNPTEAMELYARTSEQVECEVLGFKVEEYVSKVSAEPSSAERRKIYEQGKYEFPDPTGEKPGFKIGRKVSLQYLKADYQTALTNQMNKLTDADVQKEYERLVEEKNPIVMQSLAIEDDSLEITTPPTSLPGLDLPDAPPMTEGGTDSDVTPPPVLEGGTTEAPKTEAPKTEAPKTEAPKTDAPKEPETESSKGDQSFNVTKSKSQFVSTTVQEKTDPSSDVTPPPATNETTPAKTPDNGETQEPTQGESPEATEPAKQDPIGSIGEILSDATAAQDEAVEDKRQPKPLIDVAEDVKRSMAEAPARKAMDEALAKAEVLVQVHFEKLLRWDHEGKKGDAPKPLNVKELADKYGLVVKETGLVDDVELLSDPIGALGVPMEVISGGRRQRTVVPVGQMVFNKFTELRPYDPETVQDMWGSQSSYLFWMVDKAETRVPSFEECQEKVDKFIKLKSAYELAMADAVKAKKEVNAAGDKTLGEVFGTRAVPTGSFTWFTSFGSARYSVPNGVSIAGEDFMNVAFSLAKNEAGVAPNATKDTIYVIQAIEPTRPISEAGEDFLANQYFKYKRIPNEAFQVGQRYTRDLSLTWNEELQKSMDFKFVDR